ncbi:SpvB/TcaC N-terminal domain-containing protein [Flavilitoribacter nigricans]|uniref:Insecticidal toxin complex protein n=1 Tax=Flavilitoribacter nigricans (strain ATCC 23147 / DSM 23189 / NBRC 102662 / NCIMB 1420 / SS-2) TaxID=1122177 RepID=A0A2D0MY94_FLAN2|nr:SpvB/TcaC N-terminal domain-containing protein [Flavilitoribacter nigricans]PHN01150.1 insecticidal toxin complex protein [Flavilitoribacter nigricans DSM 23189 = NBRC 102662]
MNTDTPNKANLNGNDQSQSAISKLTQEKPTESNAIQIPEISLPKGGGALKGIDEKFEVNAANGTAGFSIPLPLTPGRNGFSPSLALSYNSGGGNGPFGLGWSMGLPSIQRKTDKRLPQYKDDSKGEEDIFMFSGVEDLVPYLTQNDSENWESVEGYFANEEYFIKRYRPRIEGSFSKIERITKKGNGTYWKVTTRENVATIFGRTTNSRIADPTDPSRIFQWLPDFSYDDKGNWIQYEYKAENLEKVENTVYEKNRINGLSPFTNKYVKYIRYGNYRPYYANPTEWHDPQLPSDNTHLFEVVFDYGEHDIAIPVPQINADSKWDYRLDPFSSYRSGFEIRTNRLCKRILMFHHFEDEKQFDGTPFGKDYLVRSLDLHYQPSSINNAGQTEVTYLQSITQAGYIRKTDDTYSKKSLPPMEFQYQNLHWNTQVRTVDKESIANLPVGLTNNYQWVDLYGEGISGILTEQSGGWFYKSNFGDIGEDGQVSFAAAKKVAPKPSFSGLSSGVLSLQDLAANGEKQIVVSSPTMKGYFELGQDENWEPFQAFEKVANINLQDSNSRLIDINGDGQPDIVVSEENAWLWYEADGKAGHKAAQKSIKAIDEEQGPSIVFADQEQSIFLADMSGDGLTDIVRIRNGEICYWANMGYGQFSAKVTMGNAPLFDYDDLFNPQYLHLADVSGTGATDILYLRQGQFKAYINLSGNAYSEAHVIDPFFPMDQNAKLSVIDLLGTGTSCIVWSSDLPANAGSSMRYIDLMSSKKPHVLMKYVNNLGKETTLIYKSSTYYYLQDKLAGKPWVTKLPFPVQVVSKLIVEEKITNVRFATEYQYHHGYYDHSEREFRGFGRVDQIDTEFYEQWMFNSSATEQDKNEALYQAPVLTKTWFHTGAFLDRERILDQFREEYWYKEYNRRFSEATLSVSELQLPPATVSAATDVLKKSIAHELSLAEWREALRSCKGMVLRQEVFALDGPKVEPDEGNLEETEKYRKQFKPYTVATHNCHIQRVQARQKNQFGVFMVTEGEALSIQYERNETDPRIAHTLNVKVDDLGNTLEAASVVYHRQLIDSALPLETQAVQAKTLITYTRNSFTNDVIQNHAYRLRQASETEIYEITGLNQSGNLYTSQDFHHEDKNILESGSQLIEYHEVSDPSKIQRRKIEHVRTVYQKDDLTGPLILHVLESKGISFESYQLAYTEGLFNHIYGDKVIFSDSLMKEVRFVHCEGDNNWWIRSGVAQYFDDALDQDVSTAKKQFYSPTAFIDPFGTITKVRYYKDYFLFIQETENSLVNYEPVNETDDVLENTVKIEQFNFRTLAPQVMRDVNDNLSVVLTDELGLVKATAILGKDLNKDGIAEFDPTDDLDGLNEVAGEEEAKAIKSFFQPDSLNKLDGYGRFLLKHATTRFLYDFEVYRNTGKPAVVASISRETHHHIAEDSKIQIAFEYSDGLGNVAMLKAQAEPEITETVAKQGNEKETTEALESNTKISTTKLRWVGNGRTILNNKGNPVKQYEPYFSYTPHFEDAPELVKKGVTPILYYDALGRSIKTDFPDGTFTKVEFDAWLQRSYDQNDTVKESRWYMDRKSPDPDPNTPPSDKDELAAWKAVQHYNTPTVVTLDTLGRPVLSIAHNRIPIKDSFGKIIDVTDEYYYTSIKLDIEGNAIEVVDARSNPVMTYRYDMLGHRVYQNSMDAGERWMLNNAMGNPVKKWDGRKHIFEFTYDVLQRPLESKVIGGQGTKLDNIYEKIIYGENQSNDKQLNLRGQVFAQYDTAGKVAIGAYDIKGAPLSNSRQFAIDYKETVHWSGDLATLLEPAIYTTEIRYDALGRVIWSQTPDGSVTEPGYNEASLLETIKVTQEGSAQLFVKNIDYDEKGQRLSITYGNNAKTTYSYDPNTFRLIQLITTAPDGSRELQNLHYTYDPVGNISEIEDKCIPTHFFNGEKTTGRNQYTYDPLYRLTQANGREHTGQVSFGKTDNWNDIPFLKKYSPGDDMAWRNYTQNYRYDAVGNILQMQHLASGGNWTRHYQYQTQNNRLESTTVGTQTYTYPHHSSHGFISKMPHLEVMTWNFRDELKTVAKQKINYGTPETTYYVYDGSGQRIRKITENQALGNALPSKKEERLYLGGIEIYKRHSGNHSGLERTTLHVMDDTRRLAMVDTRNNVNDDTDSRTTRYQFGNHLGSVTLELDQNANIISYEEYHPYGTIAYQATNVEVKIVAKRYLYSRMERDDESGLIYNNSRYYLSFLGRWLKPDPLGLVDGVNIYEYVLDNPVNRIDLNGQQSDGWSELWQKVSFYHFAFQMGVSKGFNDSVERTWQFYTKDMWRKETWQNMGNLSFALMAGNDWSELLWMDNNLGTQTVEARLNFNKGVSKFFDNIKSSNPFEFGEAIGQITWGITEGILGSKGVSTSSSIVKNTISNVSKKISRKITNVKVPATGLSVVEERLNLAKDFLEKSGVPDIDRHLKAIYLDDPVLIKNLNEGDVVFRYSLISTTEPKHYFFLEEGILPGELGKNIINSYPSLFQIEKFTLTKEVKVLESTVEQAGPGARQIFSVEIEKNSIIKPHKFTNE